MPLDHYPSVAQGQTTVPYVRSNLSEEGRVGGVTETVAHALDGAVPMKFGVGESCPEKPNSARAHSKARRDQPCSERSSCHEDPRYSRRCSSMRDTCPGSRGAHYLVIFLRCTITHAHDATINIHFKLSCPRAAPASRTLSAAGRGRAAAASAAARRAAALPRPSITQWQPASLL